MAIATRRPAEERAQARRAGSVEAPPPSTVRRQLYKPFEPIPCSCPRVVIWRGGGASVLSAVDCVVWHRPECSV